MESLLRPTTILCISCVKINGGFYFALSNRHFKTLLSSMWLIAYQIKVSCLKSCVLIQKHICVFFSQISGWHLFPNFPKISLTHLLLTMPNKMNNEKINLSHQVPYFFWLFFSFLQNINKNVVYNLNLFDYFWK